MKEEEYKPSFTFIHVFLLSIFITAISLNKFKEIGKNSLENNKKFAQIEYQYFRELEEIEEGSKSFDVNTEKVCKKADENLQNYYKTTDKSLIGLDDSNRKKSTPPGYIQALIDIISAKVGGEEGNETESDDKESRRLMSLMGSVSGESGDETKQNLIKYLMHLLPVLAFIVIAVLSIPGWIICCFCCCCNCCCCCCCKKPCCRFPFFIVTMACNAVVLIACVYGLANSNKVFVGFANLECSVMKFIQEVTDGQTKKDNSTARWIGFEGIREVLNNVTNVVKELRNDTLEKLTKSRSDSQELEKEFKEKKNNLTITFYEGRSCHFIDDGNYCLITNEFIGPEYSDKYKLTFNKMLESEYKYKVEEAGSYINDTVNNFEKVLDNSTGNDIEPILNTAMDSINSIKDPVDEVKNMVADNIVEYSDMIDEKGKLGFKLVYSVLTIVVAAEAALVIIYFIFGTTLCLKCCCCRCLNKLCIHFLWNILALLMIITFLVGSILSTVGTVGQDLVSVVSYFIGEKNLNADSPLIFGKDIAKYLKPCLIGNGDLSKALDFDTTNATSSITKLQNLTDKIDEMKVEFEGIKNSMAIQNYTNEINANKDENKSIIFNKDVALCPKDVEISESMVKGQCKLYGENNIINDYIYDDLSNSSIGAKKLLEDLEDLNKTYSKLVDGEIGILSIFKNTIRSLTSLFDDLIGKNGSIFDFLNCRFIGNNLDIILKYLSEAIGSNIYSVGVFLLVAGCSMIFSIIFTILEVIIINAAVDKKLKEDANKITKYADIYDGVKA